ncbi:SCO2583/SCO2584 N-terminal domain-containing protein [Actinomadura roseirufa]|uniref:SCO2583/SCO2584 N-terminal domain-containing protein n=1 Tax=Actinomadura roseirufa TaxID=2094049 RepID=UPI00104156AB|nr:hypothetical protein [Actinomadura roseirufa]
MPADADEPLFDDDFVRGAAFTEPSAQERLGPPPPARRGGHARGGLRRFRVRPPRWNRRTRDPSHRRAVLQVVAGVAVLLLISTGLWWWNRPGRGDGLEDGARIVQIGPGGPAPAPGAADPFAGSPAAQFAEGQAGLETPAPVAVNGLSEADMALAGVRVRRLLITGNLDANTVFQRRADAFAQALDPDQRRDFTRDLDRRGERNTRRWTTAFAPGSAEPATGVIKVHGTMTAGPGERRGVRGATVRTDHLFVYAVRLPGGTGAVTREVVRRVTEVFVHKEGSALKLWLVRSEASAAPAGCDPGDGFVHPTYDTAPGGGAPSGRPADPYDQTAPISPDRGCAPVTRV